MQGISDDLIRPPTGNYQLISPVLTHIAAAAYTGSTPGITVSTFSAQMDQTPGGSHLGSVSVYEFDTLRGQIATAVTTLADKIDSILNLADLDCNSWNGFPR